MPAPAAVPARFLQGPFRRDELIAAGVSPKVLLGRRFRRVFPHVWAPDRDLSHPEMLQAAALSLTSRARLSHVSRIQALGLDRGGTERLHFTVTGDLHIDIDGIFLHRTVLMPPTDDVGVTPAAAFVQCCAELPVIELVVIGDWLVRRGHATCEEIHDVSRLHPWRPGARESRSVVPWLDGASRSPRESEVRAMVLACGLPAPEPNAPVFDEGGREVAIVDLLFRRWWFAVEYEGRQHADDPRQFARDIGRYADLRRLGMEYLQITSSMLTSPRAAMTRLHAGLAARGYDGPPPSFGARWQALFEPVSPGRAGRAVR